MRQADPLVVALPGTLQPWDCFTRLAHLPYVLFLDSASQHPELGRYSYLTADPFQVSIARGPSEVRTALTQVKEQWLEWRQPADPKLPPFQGGLAGLWGYGIHRALERIPATHWNDFDTPDLVLGWYDWVIAFDHVTKQNFLISQGLPALQRYGQLDRAMVRADQILMLLEYDPFERKQASTSRAITIESLAPRFALPGYPGVLSNFTSNGFRKIIQQGIDYTHAGDCFQVNLSQRLLVPFRESPLNLYERLRQQSPAQCAGYFDMGDYVVASSSPERFIKIDANGQMEARPIKGTRPRGKNAVEDQRLILELEKSAKDHAENVMIVDLLRNDLGRVAEFGSITVPELCKVESNASVHHLVSVVKAQMREGLTSLDVLQATLPGGSVTGAPKVRAMEIIAELEPTARGAYCGCLGYVSFSGAMDTNILIRTFTLGRGWAQFPVGGGIVADSDPDAEYAETLHKARGMLTALA
jgi:para-aminobenzoate synthetase component I